MSWQERGSQSNLFRARTDRHTSVTRCPPSPDRRNPCVDDRRRSRRPHGQYAVKAGALGWLAVAAIGIVVWLAWPFAMSLLLGALTAFTLEPVYEGMVRGRGRPALWAVITVIANGLLVITVAIGFVTLFVTRVAGFATDLRQSGEPRGRARLFARRGLAVARSVRHLDFEPDRLVSKTELAKSHRGPPSSRPASPPGRLAPFSVYSSRC